MYKKPPHCSILSCSASCESESEPKLISSLCQLFLLGLDVHCTRPTHFLWEVDLHKKSCTAHPPCHPVVRLTPKTRPASKWFCQDKIAISNTQQDIHFRKHCDKKTFYWVTFSSSSILTFPVWKNFGCSYELSERRKVGWSNLQTTEGKESLRAFLVSELLQWNIFLVSELFAIMEHFPWLWIICNGTVSSSQNYCNGTFSSSQNYSQWNIFLVSELFAIMEQFPWLWIICNGTSSSPQNYCNGTFSTPQNYSQL